MCLIYDAVMLSYVLFEFFSRAHQWALSECAVAKLLIAVNYVIFLQHCRVCNFLISYSCFSPRKASKTLGEAPRFTYLLTFLVHLLFAMLSLTIYFLLDYLISNSRDDTGIDPLTPSYIGFTHKRTSTEALLDAYNEET